MTATLRLRQSEWFHSVFMNFTRLRAGFDFQEQGGQIDTGQEIVLTVRDTTAIRRETPLPWELQYGVDSDFFPDTTTTNNGSRTAFWILRGGCCRTKIPFFGRPKH